MSKAMSHRRENRAYVQIKPGTKLSRSCPVCKAPIGHRCGRWTGYLKAVWTPQGKPHKER